MPEAGMLEIEKLNVRYGGIHAVRDEIGRAHV